MMKDPVYSYDEEADGLSISFEPGEKASAAVEFNDNILLRFNRAERKAVGLTLMDFSVLVQLTEFGPRSFPLPGFADLYPKWQDVVMQLITSPPVNEFLKLSFLTPAHDEPMPIARVERPPARAAV